MRGAQSRPLEIGGLLAQSSWLPSAPCLGSSVPPPRLPDRAPPVFLDSNFRSRLFPKTHIARISPPARTTNLRHLNCSSSRWKQLTVMDNSAPGGGHPRTFPDVHPSTQKYFDRLATRKKSYSLRCSVEEDQTSIAGPDDGLVSDFDPFDILRLESLALEDRNSPIELPRKSQTSTTCRQCDSANIVRYSALSLLLKGPLKASGAAQPQEASPGAGETSKVIHTTSTDEGKILGETADPKRSPVEAHQTSPAASRTETQPDPLPADDEGHRDHLIGCTSRNTKTPRRTGSAPSRTIRNRIQPHQYRSASSG